MAALPTATGQDSPAALPDASRRLEHSAQEEQLALLRSLLVGPLTRELEALRQRVAELEDPGQRTVKLAEQLPQALTLQPVTRKEMAAALSPLLKATLWEMRRRGDPNANGTIRETVTLGLNQVRSRIAGIAGAVFGRFARKPQIMRLRLVHRARHAMVEEYIGAFDEPEAGAAQSMLELLQEKLRDPEILAGYDFAESIRVDHITYGIHVGPMAILLSAIRGRRPEPLLSLCKASLEKIHQAHAVALGVFDPAEPWQQLLSGETSVFEQTRKA